MPGDDYRLAHCARLKYHTAEGFKISRSLREGRTTRQQFAPIIGFDVIKYCHVIRDFAVAHMPEVALAGENVRHPRVSRRLDRLLDPLVRIFAR